MSNDKDLQRQLSESFGPEVGERLTSRLPGIGPKTLPYGYTSESEIRERVLGIVKKPARTLSAKQLKQAGLDQDSALAARVSKPQKFSEEERLAIAERWIQKLLAQHRKQARLMSDQQLADWRMSRRFTTGDRARYIGPTRNEIVQAQLIVPREHGQTGIITSVLDGKEARIITFHPNEAVAPLEAPGMSAQLVDLVVREHTGGWLMLERTP